MAKIRHRKKSAEFFLKNLSRRLRRFASLPLYSRGGNTLLR